jgi:inositol phosphorylceramide mannosyltransferase catalytic subunit
MQKILESVYQLLQYVTFNSHKENWNLYRQLFGIYSVRHPMGDYIIPKKIHFVWLGSPLPERYQKMVDSWIKFHPEWEVKVWTEVDIEPFQIQNKLAFDKATNWGEKSDIWRYEILHRFGGLYVDTDFECVKPFDVLHKSCEFYTGICSDRRALLGNGLIGSSPQHPILTKCIEKITVGSGDQSGGRIQEQTGPFLFTDCFMEVAGKYPGKVVAFPSIYFYPLAPQDRVDDYDTEEIKKKWLKPESFAIHYWAASWCEKKESF